MSASVPESFSAEKFSALALRPAHWALYQSIYCCSETMRYVAPARTEVQARKDFERALWFGIHNPKRHQLFAVYTPEAQVAGALCGYQSIAPGVFELGLLLLPGWQGQGLGTAIVLALEAHLRLYQRAEEFSLQFAADHYAMMQVAKRLAYAIKPIQAGRLCLATKSCTASC